MGGFGRFAVGESEEGVELHFGGGLGRAEPAGEEGAGEFGWHGDGDQRVVVNQPGFGGPGVDDQGV